MPKMVTTDVPGAPGPTGASQRRIAQARGTGKVTSHELIYDVPHVNFINVPFAYAKPGEPNRFNGTQRGVWYAGFEVETSVAEVSFHMTKAFAAANDFNAVVEYAEMFASFAGENVDLGDHPRHPSLNRNESVTAQYVERAPKPAELFSRGAHDATATFDIGNPNLKIETAQTIEAGLRRAVGPVRAGGGLSGATRTG